MLSLKNTKGERRDLNQCSKDVEVIIDVNYRKALQGTWDKVFKYGHCEIVYDFTLK